MAKEKLLKKTESAEKPNMANAAKELIRLKRKEKATDFISHVKMAYNYKPSSVYQGKYQVLQNSVFFAGRCKSHKPFDIEKGHILGLVNNLIKTLIR